MEPQIRFCTSADGTRIAYATLGEGPPLVQVEGWGGSVEQNWAHPEVRRSMAGLAEERRLVAFDRRGSGASRREVDDFSLEAQVADVAAVAHQLQLERFDLWGTLDGASIAVAYAAQHPERASRLVLWAPYPCGGDVVRPEAARSIAELARDNWGLTRKALADLFFPNGPIKLQHWLSHYLRESLTSEIAAKCLKFYASVDVRPYLTRIKAPTLVLHRSGDRNVPIRAGRAVAALIPDARFVALDGDICLPYFGDISYLETVTQFLDEGRAVKAAATGLAKEDVHTILFTDVEGSSALTQRLGDAKARDMLREHERMVREALKAHGGSEVKALGDGFMTSFSSATKALECAIAMQRAFVHWNAGVGAQGLAPLHVRIGLNAGEPIAEDDPDGRSDLFGTAVNRAARITATAKGDEILVANVVRELAEGKDFLFADRGEASLKGFDEPVRLYEVRWREE